MDAATGNERRPTVARRYAGICRRCDADQAMSNTNYTEPGMVKTDCSVFATL